MVQLLEANTVSAVYRQYNTCDISGSIAGQEISSFADISGLAHNAHGRTAKDLCLSLGITGQRFRGHFRINESGRNGIYADAIGRKFYGP